MAFRMVLRRCWKAAATSALKTFQSTGRSFSSGFGTILTIEEVTLGAGVKAPGGTGA